MKFGRRKLAAVGILLMVSILGLTGVAMMTVKISGRAVISYPRMANAIRGPASPGPGHNTTDYLSETMTIWVAADPIESTIPREWKDTDNWDVALLPSVLPTANCSVLNVVDVVAGSNKLAYFGDGADANNIYPTAVGLVCEIPADIPPLTFHLSIGFKVDITPERQQQGLIDLIPHIGSWQGDIGSAGGNFGASSPFLVTEPNCVSIPWIYDARTSSTSYNISDNRLVNPFRILHVTDTHYNVNNNNISVQNWLWQNDSQVLAPDVIFHTGDVTDNADEHIHDYMLAYENLNGVNLPIIMTNGNHDQFELGPWGHFFGSMYGTVKYDDLTMIKFDSTMPMGSGLLNWIGDRAIDGREKGPVLLGCHYPLAFSYFTSGWTGLANLMINNDITAILHGHTHADLNAEIETITENYNEIVMEMAQTEDEYDYGPLFEVFLSDPTRPITKPQMVVTRSAGKPSRIEVFEDLFPGVESYSGYRLLTLSGNEVVNYTYDYDNDGIRDPFLSIPNGRLNVTYEYDPTFGPGLLGNLTWNLYNNMTESIPAARAIFKIHNPMPGTVWDLSALNKTNGAYIRTMVTDGITTWIDARVTAPEQEYISLRLEQIAIGEGS